MVYKRGFEENRNRQGACFFNRGSLVMGNPLEASSFLGNKSKKKREKRLFSFAKIKEEKVSVLFKNL